MPFERPHPLPSSAPSAPSKQTSGAAIAPQDPALLLTLGRLCLQNQLWGKARDYFETSLKLERHPETCAELARLLAGLGDTERSNQLFQEGLGMLDERLLALPLPEVVRA